MKIRNGFVSNSSSSSFLLIFDARKVPKTIEQLSKLLYPNHSRDYIPDYPYYHYTIDDVRYSILDKIGHQEEFDPIKELKDFLIQNLFEYDYWEHKTHIYKYKFPEEYHSKIDRLGELLETYDDEASEEFDQIKDELATFLINKEIPDIANKKIFYLEYDDHSDFNAFMEHGGHWYNFSDSVIVLSKSNH